MKWLTIVCMIVFPLFAGSAGAEFYRYRDANGVTRFTDNLAEVPEAQRPKVKQYEEAADYMTSEEKAAQAKKEADAQKAQRQKRDAAISTGGELPSDVNDPAFVDYLNRTKVALDNEYAGLMKEKAALGEIKATLKTQKDVQGYESKVIDLNDRIKDFNRRRDEYKAKADSFNMGAKAK